jgi:bacterioferritin-associated ferredoxin
MIVCQCGVVTDRAVDSAVVAGARTVSAVCHATGAAQRCGTCVFTVKALICSHRERQLDMVDGAAGPGPTVCQVSCTTCFLRSRCLVVSGDPETPGNARSKSTARVG